MNCRHLIIFGLLTVLNAVTTLQAQQLYWIGGSGNWSDRQHWSEQSGGKPAGIIPDAQSQVVFDLLSFDGNGNFIKIDQDANCASMQGVGLKPYFATLSLDQNTRLHIHGDFLVKNTLKLELMGQLVLIPEQQSRFDVGEQILNCQVEIQGNGALALASDLLLNRRDLILDAQVFDAKGYTVVAQNIHSGQGLSQLKLNDAKLFVNDEIQLAEHISVEQWGAEAVEGSFSSKKLAGALTLTPYPATPTPCATNGTPYTIEALVLSDYNGENVSCHDASDGIVTVEVVGGIGPFKYTWLGGSSQGNKKDYENLGPGTYTIIVQDLGQGISCVDNVQITEPAAITVFDFNFTPPTCNGLCNGNGFPIVIGGVPGYTYNWSSGETSLMATKLCEGDNQLIVTDLNGCQFDTTFVVELDQIYANITTTDITCGGSATGSAISVPVGGDGGPYIFDWSTGESGDEILNLIAGDYSLSLTDGNGCTIDTAFTLIETIPLDIQSDQIIHVECNGVNDGAISVSVSGGTPPYVYLWEGPNGFSADQEDISGLEAGLYTLTVNDQLNCVQSSVLEIISPDPIVVDATVLNVLCAGENTGQIDLNIQGGNSPYVLNWTGPNGFSSADQSITDLIAGTYDLSLSDDTGCPYSDRFEISEAAPLVLLFSPTQPLCADALGAIDLDISGGTPPYQVLWTDGLLFSATSQNIIDLPEGTYNATVTDDAGCIMAGTSSIVAPEKITVTESITPLDCSGANIAAIDISISGGTPGYLTDWTGPNGFTSSDEDLINLEAGSYNLLLTDANGCAFDSSYSIDPPILLSYTPSITHLKCFGINDGAISLNITSGLSPFTTTWTGPDGFSSNNRDINGLASGDYQLVLSDANNCSLTEAFTLTEAPEIVLDPVVTDILCFGQKNGAISIGISGGNGAFTSSWTGPNGFNASSKDINNLGPGTYDLAVMDGDGCSTAASYEVKTADEIQVTAQLTSPNCFGGTDGSITLDITGGVSPYDVLWSNGANSIAIFDLPAGTYDAEISDDNGCILNSTGHVLDEGTLISASFLVNNINCAGETTGSIETTLTGGQAPFDISWTGPDGFSANTANISDLALGDYQLHVTDLNACVLDEEVSISAASQIEINLTPSNPDCGTDLGSISTAVTGGIQPYSFAWTGPNGFSAGTADISDLATGTYGLTVTDSQACVNSAVTDILIPEALQVSAFPLDLDCSGSDNGEIQIIITGGSSPYTTLWTGPNGYSSTDEDIFDLAAGQYQLQLSDALSCTLNADFELIQPNIITLAADVFSPKCQGEATGSIDLSITGGTAPILYLWTGPNGFSSPAQDIANLIPGDYQLQLSDKAGCLLSETYSIADTPAIDVITDTQNILCAGDQDGSIALTVSGGTAPYTYNWTGPAGYSSNAQNISALSAGIYNLEMRDANNCLFQSSTELTEAPAIEATFTVINANCGVDSGEILAEITGGVAPLSLHWTNDQGDDLGAGTNLTNLPSGNYNLLVTDANNCSELFQVGISDSEASVISSTNNSPTCFGEANGNIDVDISGGTAPFIYAWTGPNGFISDSKNLSGIAAGDYWLTVEDSLGCKASKMIPLSEPEDLLISATVTDIFCNAGNDGAIDLHVSGGTEAYAYEWTGPNGFSASTQDLNDLALGAYSVVVTDSHSCVQNGDYSILENPALGLTFTANDSLCFGQSNGWIDMNVIGGTAPYTYHWTGPNGFTSINEDLTAIEAGVYQISLNDNFGCVADSLVVIYGLPEIEVVISVMPPGCLAADGSIQASVSGGSGNYTYLWEDATNGATLGNTSTLNNAMAGVYILMVSDDLGCDYTETITLSDSQTDLVTDIQHVTCFGLNNATIVSSINGGIPPFIFDWSGPNGFTSNLSSISDLVAGDYLLKLTDSIGCATNKLLTVNQPEELLIDLSINEITCHHLSDGSIRTAVSGGTAGYSYKWSSDLGYAADTQDISDLASACYSLKVTDAHLCEATADYCLINPDSLELNTWNTAIKCFGDSTGAIISDVAGGMSPYEYTWIGPQGFASIEKDISGLFAGAYKLSVTDQNGCLKELVTDLLQNPLLATSTIFSKPLCHGDSNGTISLSSSGGSGTHSISWNGDNGFSSNSFDISDLTAGDYQFNLTDSLGCTISGSINLPEPDSLKVSVIGKSLNCYQIADGALQAMASGGTPDFIYIWTGPNGFAMQGADISSLRAGTYHLELQDKNGCQEFWSGELTEPALLQATLDSLKQPSCIYSSDGRMSVSASGGNGAYKAVWSSETDIFPEVTLSLDSVVVGLYQVSILDSLGCSVTLDSLLVKEKTSLSIFTSGDVETCYSSETQSLVGTNEGGELDYWTNIDGDTLSTDGILALILGPGNYQYIYVAKADICTLSDTVDVRILALPYADAGTDQFIFKEQSATIGGAPSSDAGNALYWHPALLLTDSTESNPVVESLLESTQFSLRVTDVNGCVSIDSAWVYIIPEIEIPSGFSPNGDGMNDRWLIGNIEHYPNSVVRVYSRWGDLLYEATGTTVSWDGNYNGNPMPIGTYYYMIEINEPEFRDTITGPLTILR